jgi:hypothetical protein
MAGLVNDSVQFAVDPRSASDHVGKESRFFNLSVRHLDVDVRRRLAQASAFSSDMPLN